jgi:hypothetical protein
MEIVISDLSQTTSTTPQRQQQNQLPFGVPNIGGGGGGRGRGF